MASVYDVKRTTKNNTVKSSVDDEGYITKTFVETYSIALDDGTTDDSITVQSATQAAGTLPKEGSAHPNNRTLHVTNIDTVRESVIYYVSTVTYATPPFRKENEDQSPLELPAQVEYFTAVEDRPTDDDYDGNPVESTAGELIPLTVEQTDLGVTVTKNMLVFDPVSIYLFNNKVNSDSFLGFPAGTAKIHDIKARNAVDDEIFYWVVTVQILFREPRAGDDPSQAWYQRILNNGYYAIFDGKRLHAYIETESGDIVAPGTSGAEKATQPIKLNADGEPLADNADPHFLKIKVCGETSFSQLGLF